MKIGNNGYLVLGPFYESTPCLMIVLMNCQTKLRINHLTAVKSVAILENESRFNLWDQDGRICVRCFTDKRCLPECVIEQQSGLTPEVVVWGVISYHGRSNLQRIEGIPGAIFQLDNARPHVEKAVRDFCSAQHMQLLLWPAYSPDMSPIEHVWDLVGRHLARDPRPAASKDELLLRIQAIWNSLPQADIQNLFDSLLRRIAALIAAHRGYTKY
ncbi:transposable element Tcb2 transposase [Trichonephila clavipes]|nr:transposable element Tcb2 transposase [Trichonephila clavipes]